ncbi:Aste57867_1206 [Aphanomyces stellatus]|uniref:Aste57867_1206 protein n=1 Tax=Aphanomyces stellatus TaxID=120398 RepID=A0A485K4L4_9STRA|nr:hypothetical protein As57867_001205 [Aphanomyces stellatus]VFT78426.1 Aste57867_1206 [Aphanomyces stellatus]
MSEETLVFGGSVYVHEFDAATLAYRPLSDSALGLALMGSVDAFRLFCYNRAQEEMLSTPLTVDLKFTPQQDHYVNFYDAKNQNFSMRFKDDAQVATFLQAVACIKLCLSRATGAAPSFDDVRVGDGYAVQLGDIVGMKIQAWKLDGLGGNPIDVVQSAPVLSFLDPDDLHKVKLGDGSTEGIAGLSAQMVGMQKGGVRYLFLSSTSWVLAYVELLKVKKEKPKSVAAGGDAIDTPPESKHHDELISRMAHLSRMGSGANVLVLPTTTAAASSSTLFRRNSQEPLVASPEPSRIATPLTLVQQASEPATAPPSLSLSPPQRAASVVATFQPPTVTAMTASAVNTTPQVESLRKEQETLLQEQQELARLRRELDEARQRTAATPEPVRRPTPPSMPTPTPPVSSSFDASFLGNSYMAPYGAAYPPTAPSPVYPPMSSPPSYLQPPPTSLYAPPLSSSNSETDATLQRVQRTTLSMEGMLIELQRKMDRLLTQQPPSNMSYNSSLSLRRHDTSSSSSGLGGNSLLKNMERVLSESDSLHEDNARLAHQVQELQRFNGQLQDDLDRQRADAHQRQSSQASMYASMGEVQSLTSALENAKARCTQMEKDAQRWTAALEQERALRTQRETELARAAAEQTQALQSSAAERDRKIDEAREIAMAAQKKMAEEKQLSAATIEQLTRDVAQWQEQAKSQSRLKLEVERLEAQVRVERESHARDADEAKMHLEGMLQDMASRRAKQEAAERAAQEFQAKWTHERDAAAAARDGRAELFKELMNDIYFACQDAFDEDAEFTGKEVAIQVRKILKQQTVDVLAKLETK